MAQDPLHFKVLRATTNSMSGVVSTHQYAGQGVVVDPSDPANFALATNDSLGTIWLLTRNVEPAQELGERLTNDLLPHRELELPDVIGDACTAREVLEAEYEGAERLVLTGTGDLSSVTGGESVSWYGGKLREKQSGDVVHGVITGVLTPEDSANSIRIRVQFTRS